MNASQTADVVVVGGGPGGAATAITLARAGRDVVLVDKARFPRDKCCGDGLTTGALRRLDALGLDPATVPSWYPIDAVNVRSPSGRIGNFPLPTTGGLFGVVARRVDLDAALLDVARAAGVKVLDGHAFDGEVSADEHTVTLGIDGAGPVRARYAIGADGMWSPLRKAVLPAEPEPYLGDWHALRAYYTGVSDEAACQQWVWFEPGVLPGYVWSFPLGDGRANVGYGLLRSEGLKTKVMKEQWPEILARPHIAAFLGPGATPEGPVKAWPIPARITTATVTALGGRVLFVGDAARATDPMTGEGIGQALETGIAAAESVLAAGALQSRWAAARYRSVLDHGMAWDHRMAFLLARALKHRKGARAAVRIATANDWTRRNFARWLYEDYPRAVLATPGRWHRRMLAGPGAFRD